MENDCNSCIIYNRHNSQNGKMIYRCCPTCSKELIKIEFNKDLKFKQMNENLTSACLQIFEKYLFKDLEDGDSTFYDILTRYGYFTPSQKEIINSLKEAQKELKTYKSNFGLQVTFRSKINLLSAFFYTLKKEGKHLKDIL